MKNKVWQIGAKVSFIWQDSTAVYEVIANNGGYVDLKLLSGIKDLKLKNHNPLKLTLINISVLKLSE
jgi:hypothetical protein